MTFHPIKSVCILVLLTSGLHAHDLYLLPDTFRVAPKSTLSVGFHNGDSFPESEGAAHIERLKDAQLRSGSSTVPLKDLRVAGKRVVGTVEIPDRSGNFLVSVHIVPNFIEMTPDKFVAYVKEEGLTNVMDWRREHGEDKRPGKERYSKFAKSLLLSGMPDDFYRQSLGFTIEIIPEKNPYLLQAGDELPILIWFRGKPAVDLQLETAWSGKGKSKTTVIGRTDAEGRIKVPLPAAGKWRLHRIKMERCAEPAVAEWESFWASLTFEVH